MDFGPTDTVRTVAVTAFDDTVDDDGETVMLGFDFEFKTLNLNPEGGYKEETGGLEGLAKAQMKFEPKESPAGQFNGLRPAARVA